jgi:DNA replication protein DnaC
VKTIADDLAALGLRYTAENFDDVLAQLIKQRLSPVQIFEHVIKLEQLDRARRSLERRVARSRLGRFKTMADFDWDWPKRIDRHAVESALRLDFLREGKNLVLIAPQGLGKTMIAQNIAHQAIVAGHGAVFTTAAQLLLDLGSQESTRALDRRLKHYCNRTTLLIIDEVGYLSYDNRNADLLFEVISRRYEKKSIVLTTNLPFSEWSTVFPHAACTTALIDRVVHHSDIIAIEGDSFRRRQAQAAKRASTATQRPAAPTS